MKSPSGPEPFRRMPSQRRGISIIELMVAISLLTTVAGLMTPIMLRISQVRRSAQQRQLATQVASNCLERMVAGQDWEAVAKTERNGGLETWLPDLELDVSHVDDGQNGRRTTVSIAWTTANGTAARRVRLSVWQPPLREVSE